MKFESDYNHIVKMVTVSKIGVHIGKVVLQFIQCFRKKL